MSAIDFHRWAERHYRLIGDGWLGAWSTHPAFDHYPDHATQQAVANYRRAEEHRQALGGAS